MKYTFIITGKLKEVYLKDAVKDYLTRLNQLSSAEVIFLEETAYKKEPSGATIKACLDEEADKVIEKINKGSKVILIDLHGKDMDSLALADYVDNLKNQGASHIYVIIGSSYGLSDKLRNIADLKIKLSSLTFTHPMALVLSLEQFYRVEMIHAHLTYHK